MVLGIKEDMKSAKLWAWASRGYLNKRAAAEQNTMVVLESNGATILFLCFLNNLSELFNLETFATWLELFLTDLG